MLTEQQCGLIEAGLTEDVEPRKVGAYLCLHMGLMLGEVTALKVKDIDLDCRSITLRNAVSAAQELVPFTPPRVLHMPPHVERYLERHIGFYDGAESYVLTGGDTLPAFHHMQNMLTTVATRVKLGRALSAMDLRNAFIRRCIQSGMDLYSICAYIDIRQPNVIAKRFAEFFDPRSDHIDLLEQYSADYVPPAEPEPEADNGPKRMNLLILGAGSQGPVVKEIAEAIGIFDEIAFLDDDPGNKLAIGTLKDISRLVDRYPMATASFGDSALREKYMDMLENSGYIVPSLVHPSATISPNAKVERSSVIEARSVVSSGAVIGHGALISSASVIGTGARIGEFAHIGASATIEKNAVVEAFARITSGTVVRSQSTAE